MRRLLLITALSVVCSIGFAQTPTLQQKLYYTCKIWGFVKYYHSNVSTCNVNWDSVLLRVLPLVETATTIDSFNDALDTMLAAAGPMAIASYPLPDTLPIELKRNRDWGWIDSSSFRMDVQNQLDTIKNNFRPHAECWVQNFSSAATSYLIFPFDSLELSINTTISYPDKYHRLLMFYKFWNIINYFDYNNYLTDIPIDSTLFNYVIQIADVDSSYDLFLKYKKLVSNFEDGHAEGWTASTVYFGPPGFWQPPIRLRYIDSNYVVVQSKISGIYPGETLMSVDGYSISFWEDSLKKFISAGNISCYHYAICQILLSREYWESENLGIQDSSGITHTFTVICDSLPQDDPALPFYYPIDSFKNILWTTLACNIGYVNMGNLQIADVYSMYHDLKDKNSIIFDLRNYPNSTEYNIANLMYASPQVFAKGTLPDVNYPGTSYWANSMIGLSSPPNPYSGHVIILINEVAISQAEYACMMLQKMNGSIVIGSPSEGAPSSLTDWKLSQDIYTGFTTLGTFYPNGDKVQRIGVKVDSVIYPTKAGIRHHDDEVLDKAIQIACNASVQSLVSNKKAVKVFPNPSNNAITVTTTGFNSETFNFRITDVTGRALINKTVENNQQETAHSIDISKLPNGIYFLNVVSGDQNYFSKFVKE